MKTSYNILFAAVIAASREVKNKDVTLGMGSSGNLLSLWGYLKKGDEPPRIFYKYFDQHYFDEKNKSSIIDIALNEVEALIFRVRNN